jgi:hypothetical protein
MPSLHELQVGFAAALFDRGASRTAPGIRANGLSPARRLDFYRTNVFENYRKALAGTYPALRAVLGAGCFDHLARDYAQRYPSRSGDVGAHGEHLAAFLERHPLAGDLPYLADLARLEWAIEECFYEADHVPIALEALARVAEEDYAELRFLLAPSCRLLASRFPVHRIWRMSMQTEAHTVVDLAEGGVQLLVRRQGYEVVAEPLAPGEHAMLDALRSGYGLAEALAYAQSVEAAFEPGAFLQRRVGDGVLCGFTLPAEAHAPERQRRDQAFSRA